MPRSSARLCNGCGQAVRGRCPTCAKPWASSRRPGSTRASRKLRARVLQEQPICAWPGCTALSAEDDHVTPLSQGGSDHRDNHQGLCHDHHIEKTKGESRPRQMATQVTLVCGPPCGGKNTYVAAHRQPGDLVVDLDALTHAIGGADDHDQPPGLRPLAFDARDAILHRLWSGRHDLAQAWVILCAPSERERHMYRVRGSHIVMVTADPDVLYQRAADERGHGFRAHIDDWLAAQDSNDIDEVVDTTRHARISPHG